MTTVRVTQTLRQHIANAAAIKATAKMNVRIEELHGRLIPQAVRSAFIPDKIREVIDNLPEEHLSRPYAINVLVGGVRHNVTLPEDDQPGVPDRSHRHPFKIPKSHPLAKLLVEYQRLIDARHAKQVEIKQSVHAVIGRCSTLNQLIEAWPGAKEFLPSRTADKVDAKPAAPPAEALKKLKGLTGA